MNYLIRYFRLFEVNHNYIIFKIFRKSMKCWKYGKITIFRNRHCVKYHRYKLHNFFIIIKFKFYSNTLTTIFIILQILVSSQGANQNRENLGMTQGAIVNKCVTKDPHKYKWSGTAACSLEAGPSTRYPYD